MAEIDVIAQIIASDSRFSWRDVSGSGSMVIVRTTRSEGKFEAERSVALLLDTDTIPQYLWPAGEAFSKWVIGNRHFFDNKRVLELGSGTGFGGVAVVSLTQALSVLMTDCSPVSLAMLKLTCSRFNDSSRLGSAKLLWGCEDDEKSLCPHSDQRFDVILGCDVFYFQHTLVKGLETARRLLNSTGVFICASAVRSDRMDVDLDEIPLKMHFKCSTIADQEAFKVYHWTPL